MTYNQLRRYKYLLILVLIFMSALFFNYVFVYAAFTTNSESGFNIQYTPEIDFTASAINEKLSSVTNLTGIVFDYDDGEKYETVKSNGIPFVSFAGQEHISSYAVAITETATTIYFLSEDSIMAPTSCEKLFYNLSTVLTINIANLNTSNTTSMKYMFCGCSSLNSILCIGENFDTSKVTNMGYMFNGCTSLTNLNLSSFNTGNVTSMLCMFYDCEGLQSLNVGNFNTSNVTDMYEMFYGCKKLTSLNVLNFNTSKVVDMYGMFMVCSQLTSLDLSNFNTANVTKMAYMFYLCENLNTITFGSDFTTSKVTTMQRMFSECSLTSLDVSDFDTSNVTNMEGMFFYAFSSRLTSLNVSNFNTSKVTSMTRMFGGGLGLTSLDVSNFDTSNVTGMFYMFYACKKLTSLDLSSFQTGKVTGFGEMFARCSALTTIYVSNGWNMDKVTSSSGMFTDCSSLVGGAGTTYNASYTDKTYARIDGGTSAPGYFSEITLVSGVDFLDLMLQVLDSAEYSPFALEPMNDGNTPQNIIFDYYKEEYASIISGAPSIAVDNAGKGYIMCYVVDNGNYISSKTDGVQDCKDIYVLSERKIKTGTDCSYMFGSGCRYLETIIFNNFDTSNATDMTEMFSLCINLRKIYVNDGWNTDSVIKSDYMFGSDFLVGGAGTKFNELYTDKTYARIDGGTSAPGYLTDIADKP